MLVGSYCSHHAFENEAVNRLDVYTYAGRPVVTFTGDTIGLSNQESGAVTVSGSSDQPAAYVFKDDAFFRLPDGVGDAVSATDHSGRALVAWTRSDGTYVIARMR